MLPNETNETPTTPPLQPLAPEAPKKKKTTLLVAIGLLIVAAVAALYFVNPSGIFPSLGDDNDDVATVTITDTGFVPQTIKIKKGQTVQWVNNGITPHQVASDPYPDHSALPHLFAESPLGTDESFSYTFEDTGTYTYHDQLKPAELTGTVIVE